MCIRNLSISLLFCTDIRRGSDDRILSFAGIFDDIEPFVDENGEYYIGSFNIVADINAIFDYRFEDSVRRNVPYVVRLRLTKIDEESKKPDVVKSTDVGSFKLFFNCENIKEFPCSDVSKIRETIEVGKLSLPHGLGEYAFKALICKENDIGEDGELKPNVSWTTQTVIPMKLDALKEMTA